MGAGKSTIGPQLAARLGRSFVSVDALVEARTGMSIVDLFSERGEAAFRTVEEETALDVLGRRGAAVVELGGGAVSSEQTRAALRESAFAILVETTPEEAWARVGSSGRPLARDAASFHALFDERLPLYEEVADARARDVDDAVLAAAAVRVENGATAHIADLVPEDGPLELVADTAVLRLHGRGLQAALGQRLSATHEVPAGERAKSLAEAERLWSALRLQRGGTVLALGGGSTLDLAGFVAATHLRGIPWVPVPTTLVAQVDAAIGGKTAVDLPGGKNLVGAFHWPARVVVDTRMLATLPADELRNGLAEVVKTGLLAGDALWELDTDEQVRRCAAFKAAVCLRDPFDRGDRAQLNLGHTFAHALEAASGYDLPHGKALALGLLAALQLSGLDEERRTVEQVLRPDPVHVDRDAAWAALERDKKADGAPRLVLLDAPGRPRWGVELEPADVRSALDLLII
jgi:shikimate kinase / 3-dehydroquinate synthase